MSKYFRNNFVYTYVYWDKSYKYAYSCIRMYVKTTKCVNVISHKSYLNGFLSAQNSILLPTLTILHQPRLQKISHV